MRSEESRLLKAFYYVTLLLGSLIVLFPPYTVFITSLKSKHEFLQSRFALPENLFNLDNYVFIFEKTKLISTALPNTLYIIAVSVAGNIVLGTMVAYALGRFEFKLKKYIIGAYLLASVIPLVTTQVATYKLMNALGLINNIHAPILLNLGADVISIIIYLQFSRNIAYALDESAMLEGASLFRIYWQIFFPLLLPATVTVVILRTIYIYNDFYIPFLYLTKPSLQVVSTSIFQFVGPNAASWNNISAMIFVIFIPAIVLFLFLQKFIYAGVTSGSVKG
ncbi:carbohydrate ABC transporter permease [Paenibacillus whitsoniae]|uniref:Carbohydrate ABC transporter permease n=1 Tax=Paenibacillus whitsoniae TaxID=2496558 RepID=A0A3S0BYN7_9BACL|nr:carbohydrate ABC transporter permease [Paenibacillus whitsoniae]RTE11212.1 carbohydrate ABC transporter permease [Paenibacillus whitsoniae]